MTARYLKCTKCMEKRPYVADIPCFIIVDGEVNLKGSGLGCFVPTEITRTEYDKLVIETVDRDLEKERKNLISSYYLQLPDNL